MLGVNSVNKSILSLLVLIFIFGWLTSSAYSQISADLNINKVQADFSKGKDSASGSMASMLTSPDVPNPGDRISEDKIHVYDDRIVIEIDNPEWSTFTDTNSMDPLLDIGANAIHIVPQIEDEIELGDIVAYRSEFSEGTIIHRIVAIDSDEEGKFFVLKGDNNPFTDPGKVRFNQIERVLVAIIY